MKNTEFENRMFAHAARVKGHIAVPALHIHESSPEERPVFALRRLWLVAVAAVFLLGTTAFAAGAGGGWFAGREKEYSALPAVAQYVEDVGYAPALVQSFENGYSFARGYVENNRVSEGDEAERSFKSSSFEYEKDGDILWLIQEKSGFPAGGFGSVFKSFDGIELWYYSYTNKFVPEDYEVTDADRQAEAEGSLIITYGPEEIYTAQVSSLSWTADGINYTLTQTDGRLSAEELCAMAEEIIAGRGG